LALALDTPDARNARAEHKMIVGIALDIDEEINRLSRGVGQLSVRLKDCFADKTYGHDIECIFIGLILTGPGSERLHPVRPLKYRREFTLKNSLTRTTEYLGNTVEFDIKPDYAMIRTMNAETAEKHIIDALIDGLDALRKNHSKFPNFDLTRFTKAFTECLRK
jgi:hypothetical protein